MAPSLATVLLWKGPYTVVAAPGVFNGRDDDLDSYAFGSVKVFDTTTGALLHILAHPLGYEENFGVSVGISGTRIVVGAAPGYENQTGNVYVYDLASTTPAEPVLQFDNPSFAFDERFGSSVAISGTRVVVGNPGKNTGASSSGVAYVYDLNSATPTIPVSTLDNPSPSKADRFGASVAIRHAGAGRNAR